MSIDPRLAHLGHTYGIATQFWDWKGQYREPDEATILACLRALDVDTESEDWLNRAFVEADERIWLQPLPDCIVAAQEGATIVRVGSAILGRASNAP